MSYPRWRVLVLCLPLLISFTYVIPLLARLLAFGAWTIVRERRWPRGSTVVLVVAGLAAGLACLYLIDLQYTSDSGRAERFWRKCVVGSSRRDLATLVHGYLLGWFDPGVPHSAPTGLHPAVVFAIAGAIVVGLLDSARSWLRPSSAVRESQSNSDWGSRTLAAPASLIGLLLASPLVHYPICAGRLTFFNYFMLQWVVLDGLQAISRWLPGNRYALWSMRGAVLALSLALLPAAARNVDFLVSNPLIEDIRPMLPHIEQAADRPIMVADCATWQVRTFSDWIGRSDILYYADEAHKFEWIFPEGEFWYVAAGSIRYCPRHLPAIERISKTFELQKTPTNAAQLYLVEIERTPSSD